MLLHKSSEGIRVSFTNASQYLLLFVNFLTFFLIEIVRGDYVVITHNGPSALGSTITFNAQLYDNSGHNVSKGHKHRFTWTDNALPRHAFSEEGLIVSSQWSVLYDSANYAPGLYEVEVKVARWSTFIYWQEASKRITINVTSFLNGQLELIQNNTVRLDEFVSSKQAVTHRVSLTGADEEMVSSNGTKAVTYWFLGCDFYGSSPNLNFTYNYTEKDLDMKRVVRALVVVHNDSDTFNGTVNEGFAPVVIGNESSNADSTGSYGQDCEDFPIVPQDPHKYYGYFKKHVTPTAPVVVSNIDANSWLKAGDVFHMNVTCFGSSPFYHCVYKFLGEHDAIGNETCVFPKFKATCGFEVNWLLNSGDKYTFLFVVGNKVSTVIKQVRVTRYSEKHHPQLSVVIVPIGFSAVALVLIIFGVAYYIQTRNRFKIEVADFDFSKVSDTEYRTFKERLRDSFSSAFTRVKDEDYSEEGPSHQSGGGSVWSPTRKSRPPRAGGLLYDNSDSDQ